MTFETLVGLLPNYSSWELSDYLIHTWWGFIGAWVRLARSNGAVKRPERLEDGSLKLNAIAEWFTAFVFGFLANHNPLVSVAAAWLAPSLVEEIESTMRQGVRVKLRKWLDLEQQG